VEREDALPRLVDHLLAEFDGLGQDDLFLGGEERDLADLLQVHPDRVVDPDHVGGKGLELLGGGLVDGGRVKLDRRVAGNYRIRDRVVVGGLYRVPIVVRLGRRVEVIESSSSSQIVLGGAARAHAGKLGFFQIGLAAAASGKRNFDELLVQRVSHRCPPADARMLVSCRRRPSDLRASYRLRLVS
jgi:hypothetical protein